MGVTVSLGEGPQRKSAGGVEYGWVMVGVGDQMARRGA